jgi:hypothetical protein
MNECKLESGAWYSIAATGAYFVSSVLLCSMPKPRPYVGNICNRLVKRDDVVKQDESSQEMSEEESDENNVDVNNVGLSHGSGVAGDEEKGVDISEDQDLGVHSEDTILIEGDEVEKMQRLHAKKAIADDITTVKSNDVSNLVGTSATVATAALEQVTYEYSTLWNSVVEDFSTCGDPSATNSFIDLTCDTTNDAVTDQFKTTDGQETNAPEKPETSSVTNASARPMVETVKEDELV